MKAEPKKNTYNVAPWTFKKGEIDDFIKVTEENRKNARVIGRIFYVIEKSGNNYIYKGSFAIEPCLMIGWWEWPFMPFMKSDKTHYRVYIDSNKSRDEWAAEYKYMLDKFISEGSLYIKQTDPILKYIKQ